MSPITGKLYVALIVSALLSCAAAWIIAYRYRRRMQHLMRAPHGGDASAPLSGAVADAAPPRRVSLDDNRRAARRLTALLVAVSGLVALSSSSIWWKLTFPGDALTPRGVVIIALFHLWPVIPGLALVWRWSRTRLAATWVLWCVALFLILQLRISPGQVLSIMASEMAVPLVLFSLVFLSGATRAIAPWLLVPAAALVLSLLAGLDALTIMAARESPVLKALIVPLEGLPGWMGVSVVFALFAVLAGAAAWWPVRICGRALGHAYSRKWLSELPMVFGGVWAFALTDRALTLSAGAGGSAAVMCLPWLWIPAVLWLARGVRQPGGRAPTLLVLRVFQQDEQARSLFDRVVDRWRLSGNTVMIAGTDLADRTVDADDIFTFLDRRLAERFVVSPGDVARRIAAFDMEADVDGRYRINECYCHDTTWQDALKALLHTSDVVLMDLRGFQAHNAGCRYELAALAGAPREIRVVILFDGRTDRAAARESIGSGRPDRFTWIDASRFGRGTRLEILASLFARNGTRRPDVAST